MEGTEIGWSLPMFFIPFKQIWVSRILREIWYLSTSTMTWHSYKSPRLARHTTIKIKYKLKQKKRDFGYVNMKQGKGDPKLHSKGQSKGGVIEDNPPNLQGQENTEKLEKYMGMWFESHKSSTHNTSECRAKQSLVAEMKAYELDACSNFESEPHKGNDKGQEIIDVEPNATISTMKVQKEDSKDVEEENLFHSQMCVRGSSLQFIIDRES